MPCRPVADVSDAQADQVTGSKLAVDGEVEQCQITVTTGELQANPDRPDLFELQRRLLTYELSFVPGFREWSLRSECVPWLAPVVMEPASLRRVEMSLINPPETFVTYRFSDA
jgi:hypothetical protein